MITFIRHRLWLVACFAAMGGSVVAGEFAPPAEGPVAFRRDQLPLDVDAMCGLASQLETLARNWNADTASHRRGAAQMLALAVALDPANTKIRELLTEYRENRHQATGSNERRASARTWISQYLAWLQTPAAGRHGQALAACLKDILKLSDPQRSPAEVVIESRESGAWTGWIPRLAAYETKVVVKTAEPKKPVTPMVPAKPREILLSKAEVHTMLWHWEAKDNSGRWVLGKAPIQMNAIKVNAEEDQDPPPFAIVIGAAAEDNNNGQPNTTLCNLLKKKHPALPAGYRIAIDSTELQASFKSRKLQSISAAAAVLASSALTGREPEAIIIGQVDESGAFKLPTGIWDQLQALGKGNGQRLVLPAAAAKYLPSILAMENPGFFLEYEVLLAENFQQLLELSAKSSADPLKQASTQFRAIQDKASTQDVRQYIANRFVRQRLEDVLRDLPCHFSARMLLIQSAGKRPTLVARPVLAVELRRALDPMKWLLPSANTSNNGDNVTFDSAEILKLAKTYDLCQAQVNRLERYVDKNDRELLERTLKMVTAIRSLEKAARTRGDTSTVSSAVRYAYNKLLNLQKELIEELAREAEAKSFETNP